jgi:adenosylcobinamide-phosphate guanylyltransferase
MGFAVKSLGLETVLAIGADLPLLTGKVVDEIVDRFFSCGKAALAVAVPQQTREKLGLGEGYVFNCGGKCVVYAGINVLDGGRIEEPELEQEVLVLDQVQVAVNINTVDELQIAQNEFVKFSKGKT